MSKVVAIPRPQSLQFIKSETFSLKESPEHDEFWVQDIIANDPSILGLGDLILKDKERLQPRAGRLDILLQDPDEAKRYTVEIQLGTLDESHIIRAIEYWDLEKKRFPQYDHTAVIVAEDITSRFLNVISLFNGTIPIVAIQMSALKIGDQMTLNFTRVLDELKFGLEEDTDDTISQTDRAYWESVKSTPENVKLVDECLGWINEFAPGHSLNYNKHYIGLLYNRRGKVPVVFKPRKGQFSDLRFEIKLEKTKETDSKLEGIGAEFSYNSNWKQYHFSMSKKEIQQHKDLLVEFFKEALEK